MGLIGASLKSCLSYLMFTSYVSFEFAKEQDYRSIYAFLLFADILLNGNFDFTNILLCIVKLIIYYSVSEYFSEMIKTNVFYRVLVGNESKTLVFPLLSFIIVDMWF